MVVTVDWVVICQIWKKTVGVRWKQWLEAQKNTIRNNNIDQAQETQCSVKTQNGSKHQRCNRIDNYNAKHEIASLSFAELSHFESTVHFPLSHQN